MTARGTLDPIQTLVVYSTDIANVLAFRRPLTTLWTDQILHTFPLNVRSRRTRMSSAYNKLHRGTELPEPVQPGMQPSRQARQPPLRHSLLRRRQACRIECLGHQLAQIFSRGKGLAHEHHVVLQLDWQRCPRGVINTSI